MRRSNVLSSLLLLSLTAVPACSPFEADVADSDSSELRLTTARVAGGYQVLLGMAPEDRLAGRGDRTRAPAPLSFARFLELRPDGTFALELAPSASMTVPAKGTWQLTQGMLTLQFSDVPGYAPVTATIQKGALGPRFVGQLATPGAFGRTNAPRPYPYDLDFGPTDGRGLELVDKDIALVPRGRAASVIGEAKLGDAVEVVYSPAVEAPHVVDAAVKVTVPAGVKTRIVVESLGRGLDQGYGPMRLVAGDTPWRARPPADADDRLPDVLASLASPVVPIRDHAWESPRIDSTAIVHSVRTATFDAIAAPTWLILRGSHRFRARVIVERDDAAAPPVLSRSGIATGIESRAISTEGLSFRLSSASPAISIAPRAGGSSLLIRARGLGCLSAGDTAELELAPVGGSWVGARGSSLAYGYASVRQEGSSIRVHFEHNDRTLRTMSSARCTASFDGTL